MLRTIFVLGLILFGAYWAAQSAFGGLLFYLWVAYFRPEAWVWNIAFIQSLNISLIAGVYLLLRAPMSDARFRADLRSVLLFLFLIVVVASTATSYYVTMSSPYFQDFVKVLIITYLLASLATDIVRIRTVLVVIALSLGFENAKQGWVTLILHPGAKNANAVINLGDENEVAVGLLMLTPVFLALANTATQKWEKRLHQFFGLGVAYRAISTYSRGGFLSAGAMAFVYVLRSKHKIRDAVVILVVGGTLLSVLPDAFWDRMSTIPVGQEGEMEQSAASRPHFWRVATIMAKEHPLLGVGQFGYQFAFDDYDYSRGFYGKGRAVHSSWFGVLAELGYTGFLLFVAIFVLGVAACERVIRRAKRGEIPVEFQHYAGAVQTGFAVFAVGGSFVSYHYREIFWHFVGISMALRAAAAAAQGTVATPERPPALPPHKLEPRASRAVPPRVRRSA